MMIDVCRCLSSWALVAAAIACPDRCRCAPAGSQRKFNKRILALGPAVVNDDFIERAVDRYCEFLALARDNPQELVVPTLDIDLIWHAHMLSPQDYHDVRCVSLLLLVALSQLAVVCSVVLIRHLTALFRLLRFASALFCALESDLRLLLAVFLCPFLFLV